MSATYQSASGPDGWGALPPTLLPPRDLAARAAVFGPVAKAWLTAHRLLEALTGTGPKQAGGGHSPEAPPEGHHEGDSIWDDPVLWMLIMMH